MSRTVFVTGADAGLGIAFVHVFLREGWRVVAGRYAGPGELDTLADTTVRLSVVPLDVSSMESVRAAAQAVLSWTAGLDLLINNAGINPDKEIRLEDLDIELSAKAINVNALGPLRVTQQMLPHLEAGEMKRIVNISSEAGSITDCFRSSWYGYAMSKAALNMQTCILQNYLSGRGFDVMSVHPGWMRSGMGSADATYAPEQSAERLYPLITGPRGEGAPMFFQHDGKALPW